MKPTDEWYYEELLKILKDKNKDKEENCYQQIELELPHIQIDNMQKDEQKIERGILIINLA